MKKSAQATSASQVRQICSFDAIFHNFEFFVETVGVKKLFVFSSIFGFVLRQLAHAIRLCLRFFNILLKVKSVISIF